MTHAHRAWLLAGATCLASAAPAAAVEPVNGRIAYTILSTPTAADGDIFTMNEDGSDKLPAVIDPLYDAQTDWSADGTRIVFRSRRNNRYEVSIVDFRVRDAAGRPVVTDVALPTDGTQSSQPAWFPDMSGVVYRRTNAPGTTRADIWAMNVDGTNRRALLTAPEDQWYPSFSPDQSKLLFSTTIRPNDRNVQVMDVATGVVTTLYDVVGRNDSAPTWSPDGRRIAFESDGELFLMDADGANVRQLTQTADWEEGPAWSPDGTRIAYARTGVPLNNNVWTMAADGTDQRQITSDPRPEESPDWGRNPAPAVVGGTVPATLSLTLAGPVDLGTFTPGLAREYTASTTATVTSTAGNATLAVADPGHLTNGSFSLPQPLRVELTPAAWTAPISNATVAITFRQTIGAADPLRTGTYGRTVTFTLSTTDP